MSARHNSCGQAYGLTVLTPIIDGRESTLARLLDSLEGGATSPLAGVRTTHFARWVIVGDVVYEGTGQRRVDHLKSGRLLFTSNFDGELEPYLEQLRIGLGDVADTIWAHCVGYPGRADRHAFSAYMRAHQLDCSLFFAAYGERSVEEVRQSLTARRRVIEFAMRSQGMAAGELHTAFLDAFAR